MIWLLLWWLLLLLWILLWLWCLLEAVVVVIRIHAITIKVVAIASGVAPLTLWLLRLRVRGLLLLLLLLLNIDLLIGLWRACLLLLSYWLFLLSLLCRLHKWLILLWSVICSCLWLGLCDSIRRNSLLLSLRRLLLRLLLLLCCRQLSSIIAWNVHLLLLLFKWLIREYLILLLLLLLWCWSWYLLLLLLSLCRLSLSTIWRLLLLLLLLQWHSVVRIELLLLLQLLLLLWLCLRSRSKLKWRRCIMILLHSIRLPLLNILTSIGVATTASIPICTNTIDISYLPSSTISIIVSIYNNILILSLNLNNTIWANNQSIRCKPSIYIIIIIHSTDLKEIPYLLRSVITKIIIPLIYAS